ncbi:MAG: dehalogenase [Dehalococcoides mccartyi]|uniref:dehalogenase n=1 Tax=Dehalococcoides mccartyi TaxID=61435 RepID=UPI000805BAA4|nr:dehalogenase [Dehalococcoides mccartyi]OBW62521.1 MAG: dehalogenase [Dehalococcoides mccartyi]
MWFTIGLIIGLLFLRLLNLLKKKSFKLTWYEWVIGFIGLFLVLFTVQNFFGSLAEIESTAASMFLLVVGLPGLILLAIVWQLAARRVKKA